MCIRDSIGPVLNWNPQTGSLQLSQIATQKLLASLGGHVTKRRDTGLTVFFPISDSNEFWAKICIKFIKLCSDFSKKTEICKIWMLVS